MVNTKFWDDNYVSNLDPIEKLLFLYFLTSPLTNISGVYEIPLRRIAFDTGIDKDMVLKILSRLQEDNKIYYLDGWIYIKNFEKHQQSNPNIEKGVERALKELPDEILAKITQINEGLQSVQKGFEGLETLRVTKPKLKPKLKLKLSASPLGEAVKTEYGNPDINICISYLKEKIQGSLDGTQKANRQYCHLLINRLKKDYPDSVASEQICKLIDIASLDDFHAKNLTSFKYLYNNAGKIIQSVKGKTNKTITV